MSAEEKHKDRRVALVISATWLLDKDLCVNRADAG